MPVTKIFPQRRRGSQSRISPSNSGSRWLWIAAVLIVWMFAIIGRLAWLQLVRHDHYVEKAQANQQKNASLLAARGSILDRNGAKLAVSLITDSVFIDQNQLQQEQPRQRAAEVLSPLLGLPQAELAKQFVGSNGFVWLRRQLEPEQSKAISDAVAQNKLPGIALRQEPQRVYPNNMLGAHIVGYIGAEDSGLAGVEQKYDQELRGTPGEIKWEKDAAGRPFASSRIPPTPGAQVYLTIDETLQHRVEVLLDEAVHMSRAKGASAVVLDTQTGEILALANLPTFNPNERPKSAADFGRANRAISVPYEPGSVFKLVAYSGAFEEGLITPDDKINCGAGSIQLGKRVINDTHAYGVLPAIDAFAKSSNVGAIRMALKLGPERFHSYIDRFGFGRKTGIELPGESRGIVHPLERWRPDSIGSVAIGQEVTITPLQAAAAMATIANGGVWTKPHVIKQVVAASGRVLYEAKPETRQVVSARTAEMMSSLLQRVVTHGTARNAIQLAGYTAAGKTGTPQKAEKGRGYSAGKFMPTFAGFVPATAPRFAIFVMIDEPTVGPHQGGQISAPVFNLIAQAALGGAAVPPDDQGFREALVALSRKYDASAEAEERAQAPIEIATETIASATPEPTPGVKIESAKSKARRGAAGAGIDVSANIVKAGAGRPEVPAAPQREDPPQNRMVSVMPELRGRGVRAVIQACVQMKLTPELHGHGLAVRQSPNPGARVAAGETCRIDFQ